MTSFAIAWVRVQGKHIVPVIGARCLGHLSEAFAALRLELLPDDIAAIEAAMPRDAVS
jgi:aryl-alcohol dehydrogenase-like predicted oxidoreductase